MNADQFRAWRKSLGLKQKDAADKLGLKKRIVQYYEKGDRDGREVAIPKSVELACFALALGIDAYDGRTMPRGADFAHEHGTSDTSQSCETDVRSSGGRGNSE